MCKYCEDGISIVDEKYLGLDIFYASNHKMYACIRGCDRRGWDTSTTFKIYYCPMCGKKIND